MAPANPQISSDPDEPDRKILPPPDAQVPGPNSGEEPKISEEADDSDVEPQKQQPTTDPRRGSWPLVITAIGALLSGIAAIVALVPEDMRAAFISTLITLVTSVF
jgi:hypothetical protein